MVGAWRGALGSVVLVALLGGCPRPVDRPDGGTDAGLVDASYDPSVGNRYAGPVVLDDDRVENLDPSTLRTGSSPCREPLLGRVYHVADGDTISVSGQSEIVDLPGVRLIGVDTPEIAHMGNPADCYGDEAAAFTQQLMGRLVWLTFDNTCLDRFDRTLAYVHVGAGAGDMWQRQLLRRGFAREFAVGDNRAFESVFVSDASIASAENLGLWAACF